MKMTKTSGLYKVSKVRVKGICGEKWGMGGGGGGGEHSIHEEIGHFRVALNLYI